LEPPGPGPPPCRTFAIGRTDFSLERHRSGDARAGAASGTHHQDR
jgi:hypothetical protein